MKAFRNLFVLALISALLFCMTVSYAAPANPTPNMYTQPDGTTIEVYTYGDEYYHFKGDAEGYLLERGEDGAYRYVTADGNTDVSLSPAANGSSRPANAVKGFDLAPERPVYDSAYDSAETAESDISYSAAADESAQAPTKKLLGFNAEGFLVGTRKLLVVVVDYNDVQIDTNILSNEKIYNNFFSTKKGDISVANYYSNQSGGKFTFVPAFTASEVNQADGKIVDADLTDSYGVVADGVIKIKVDGSHPAPNGVPSTGTSPSPVTTAMPALEPYVDFSLYNTGYSETYLYNSELTVFFLVAGYEGATGITDQNGNPLVPAIWAHSRAGKYDSEDGLTLFRFTETAYACAGAMYDKTTPLGIGSFCHELGHTLDMVDLYYKNYEQIYSFSLMNNGGWGLDKAGDIVGTSPYGLDPFHKAYRGWYNDDEVLILHESDFGEYELVGHYSGLDGYKIIKICTANDPSEYYLLENRKFQGADKGLNLRSYYGASEEGIALWRVDESKFNKVHVRYQNPNSTLATGLALMRNGARVGMNESTGDFVLNTFSGASFHDRLKPLWSSGVNKFTFFNDLSYPNNALVSPDSTDITSSGIQIEFLSEPGADYAKIRVGGPKVTTALSQSGSSTKALVFNNTAAQISTIPFVAEYGNSSLTNLVKFDRVTVDAGQYAQTNTSTLSFSDDKTYRTIIADLPSLEPYYTDPVPGDDDYPFYPDLEETVAFTLDTAGALAGMSTDAVAIKNTKVKFVKPAVAAGNTIAYFNNQVDITDQVVDMGTSVALPVSNIGDNKYIAVEFSGQTAVAKSQSVTVFGKSVSVPAATNGSYLFEDETYAGYLADPTTATAEQLALAKVLWGYDDATGETTRTPAHGNGSNGIASTISFDSYDHFYVGLDVYIDKDIISEKNQMIVRLDSTYIRINPSDYQVGIGSLTSMSQQSGVYLELNKWQSIGFFGNGSTIDIYVDGVLVGKNALTYNASAVKIYQGVSSDAGIFFDKSSYRRAGLVSAN